MYFSKSENVTALIHLCVFKLLTLVHVGLVAIFWIQRNVCLQKHLGLSGFLDHLVLVLVLVLFVGATVFKKPRVPLFQNSWGWNLAGTFICKCASIDRVGFSI